MSGLQAQFHPNNSDLGQLHDQRVGVSVSVCTDDAKAHFLVEIHSSHLSGAGLQHQLRDASFLTEISCSLHHPDAEAQPSVR